MHPRPPVAEPPAPSVVLARRLHDTIAQRLAGLSYLLGADGPAPDGALEHCRTEIDAALDELREALESVGRADPPARIDVDAEICALLEAFPEMELGWNWDETVERDDQGLIESFLVEALRNVRKHADPERVTVVAHPGSDVVIVSVVNDGVGARRGPSLGMGSRLLAIEAARQGALFESAAAQPGRWRQRLILPSPVFAVAA